MPILRSSLKLATFVTALASLAACNADQREGAIAISVIGAKQQIVEPLAHSYTTPGAILLGATAQGLVSLDASGEVVPALAQRWIVVDGGKSYIFRLRRALWADGSKVDAREVTALLRTRIKIATRFDPYGSLASVTAVKAMTADVIEIDLTAPDPDFLTMMAQPQMAIARRTGGTGPYRKSMARRVLTLTPLSAALQTQPDGTGPAAMSPDTSRTLRAERAALAIARFAEGEIDLVLGGTLNDLPIARAAKVNRRSLRFDPVRGLFGLAVMGDSPLLRQGPFLRQGDVRSALAMAIDRNALIGLYDIPKWQAQDVIDIMSRNAPDWRDTPIEERRNRAAAIIEIWKAKNPGQMATLSLRPGIGPGRRLLDAFLVQQFKAIGVTLNLDDKSPDLELIDEIDPYDSPRWSLGRVSCARKISCDPEGEKLLAESRTATDLLERRRLIDKALDVFARHSGFIPLASPVRWSLVGRRVTGFQPSRYAYHPLNQLVAPKR